MLPAASRLRRGAEITAVVRGGERAASSRPALLVVHLLAGSSPASVPRAALVVSRAVGSAVTRNRVRRRLRHLLRERLISSPWNGDLVVRAMPGAARAGYAELGSSLDAALERAGRPRRAAEVSR